LNLTPHVAQNYTHRGSAIDARTTRRPRYGVSQPKRKRVQEVFGWMKTVARLRKTYLVRMCNLAVKPASRIRSNGRILTLHLEWLHRHEPVRRGRLPRLPKAPLEIHGSVGPR
jgi:hypothetical protein